MFEFIAEFLLQIFLELVVEVGLHSLARPFRKLFNPLLAAIGYVLFGAVVGGLSLLFFPSHLVIVKGWRIANVVITPIAIGRSMSIPLPTFLSKAHALNA